MTVTFDPNTVLLIGAAALGCNILCLFFLLLVRPAAGALSSSSSDLAERLGRACRGVLAEALGTFGLIFVGVLAVIAPALASPESPPPPLLLVALAHGLALAALAAAFSANDAGHCNPAVTVGLVVAGRCHPVLGVFYVAAQLVGGVAAGALLAWLFEPAALLPALPAPAGPVSLKAAFVLEAVATFLFVLVVAGVANDERARSAGPLAVGLALTGCMLAIGPLTGGALNPARYLAPAAPNLNFEHVLVYTAGPCCGAGLAAALVQLFLTPSPHRVEDEAVGEAEQAPADEPEQRRAA